MGKAGVYIDPAFSQGTQSRRREVIRAFSEIFRLEDVFLINLMASCLGSEMEQKMRDLGTAGEKYFGMLCAAAGMAANKSETDIHGWDLFAEIDESR